MSDIIPTWGSGFASVGQKELLARRACITGTVFSATPDDNVYTIVTTGNNQTINLVYKQTVPSGILVCWDDGSVFSSDVTGQVSASHTYNAPAGKQFNILMKVIEGKIGFVRQNPTPCAVVRKIVLGNKNEGVNQEALFYTMSNLKKVVYMPDAVLSGDGMLWGNALPKVNDRLTIGPIGGDYAIEIGKTRFTDRWFLYSLTGLVVIGADVTYIGNTTFEQNNVIFYFYPNTPPQCGQMHFGMTVPAIYVPVEQFASYRAAGGSTSLYQRFKNKIVPCIVADKYTDWVPIAFVEFAVMIPPTKTVYTDGEKFVKDGMVCKGTLADGTVFEITDFVVDTATPLSVEDNSWEVSYTINGVTLTDTVDITVNPAT